MAVGGLVGGMSRGGWFFASTLERKGGIKYTTAYGGGAWTAWS